MGWLGDLLTNIPHGSVLECSTQPCSQRFSIRASNHAGTRFGREEMKKGVVRSRNCPAQAGLLWSSRFMGSQQLCLVQKVVMETQAGSTSEVVRNRT